MTSFRRIALEGPDFSNDERVWEAQLNLGHPFGAFDDGPLIRNHSIRLLSQAADPTAETIIGEIASGKKTDVLFHEPLLLSAAATTVKFGKADSASVIEILSAAFNPVRLEGDKDRYSELHVAPRTAWPDGDFEEIDGLFELAAPKLRATTGAIRVGYANPAQHAGAALSTRLAMDWTPLEANRVKIFGGLQIDTVATLDSFGSPAKKARAVAFELVPEGVEFDLRVPNPFVNVTGNEPLLELRLRLVPVQRTNRTDMRLDLVGGTATSLGILSGGLAWMSRDLAARGGNIVLQVDTRGIPPLSWPLEYDNSKKSYRCVGGTIPEVLLREDGIGVKLLTRADPAGGEPGVAEMVRHVATLLPRDPNAKLALRIESVPDQSPGAQAVGPEISLSWSDPHQTARPPGANPDTVTVKKFAGTAAVESLAARLSEIWGSSGAIPANERPPYAFIALDRGWVQIPLPDPPKRDDPKPGRASTGPSAFVGFMRIDVPLKPGALGDAGADGTSLPGLSIVAVTKVLIDIEWTPPFDANAPRSIAVTLTDSYGTLDGVLWVGEASPSPVEILPPRDAGPAALDGIPIVFGGRNTTGWSVDVGDINANGLGSIKFSLPVVTKPDGGPPLLVWQPNKELALVSSVAMTRTAESALRPSATRELIPAQVGPKETLDLHFSDANPRLPRIEDLPAGTTVHGDGRWRWPWPLQLAVGKAPYPSSPQEQAGVAVAALTLPGVEFTLDAKASKPSSDANLLVSLRFDLPILDELFANAKAPEPKIAPAKKDTAPLQETRPTALDLRRLSDAWFENARRIARARTEADRVVLKDVTLWHQSNVTTKGSVRGLVEPYVWEPPDFAFTIRRPDQDVNLGAYCLGETGQAADWYAGSKALGGLTANFRVESGGALVRDNAGHIKIDGFASSSFRAEPVGGNGPEQLHDARGLSLAFDAEVSAARLTTRDLSVRQAPGDEGLSLATLRSPIELKIGGSLLKFWFRDLPVQKTGSGFVFDRSGGIETGTGPDSEGINRNRIARTLYEWRFYPAVASGAPGEFEIPLAGPLVARPLRLAAFEMTADGEPSLLHILASVQLAPTKPSEEQAKDMVFGPEDAYGSGNLVMLKFDKNSTRPFEFRSIAQVKVGDSAEDPFPASSAELVFRAEAKVPPTSSTVSITLGLGLVAKDQSLDISSASLAMRLFGQACRLDLRDARFESDKILASCTGDPGDSPLHLKKLDLSWPKSGAPELTLTDGQLRALLRAKDAAGPFAFERDYGAGQLRWLSLTSTKKPTEEKIDHDSGVVRINLDDETGNAELFRGLLLPPGRLRGAIAFVFKRTSSGVVTGWPSAKLGSAFAEFAFDAALPTTTQRITAIRHRHVGRSDKEPIWRSSLRLDANFGVLTTSSVKWPVGHASVPNKHFDPDPAQKPDWTTTLKMDPASSFDLVHDVQPRLCAHNLPLDLLVLEKISANQTQIVLGQPWRFRAVVEHRLTPGTGQFWPGSQSNAPLGWTSIDEMCLIDMHQLARDALAEFKPADKSASYAFMARYRDGGNGSDIRIAGVVRRALANAGFPVRAILKAVSLAYPALDNVPPSLVLTGSSVTEVVLDSKLVGHPGKQAGVSFVPQWILPWAQANGKPTIAPLDNCPQIDLSSHDYKIAAYDAAGGALRRLDGPAPKAFSAQDGTQSLVDERFAAIVGASAGHAATTMPVDQAFLEDASGPADPLARPLFPRTLLALRPIAETFATAPDRQLFGQGVRCVAPSDGRPRREIKFTVSAWPRDGAPVEAVQPAVTLVVADENAVGVESLPAALAATLSDPASDALTVQGVQRAEAALRAFSLSATPRIIMLARVDDSYLTIRDAKPAADDGAAERTTIGDAVTPPPHVDWKFADAAAPGLVGQPSIVLRDRAVTIYASPALGWPDGRRSEDLARAHARLGDEEVRRSERAWAGRVRSLSWPAQASEVPADVAPDKRDGAEMGDAAFIAMGQRASFRRRAAKNLRSPPDRLAVLAPARARAPTVDALAAAFRESRIPEDARTDPKDRSRLAPLLPGEVEITITGQRPGVMMTLHEGVLLTWPHNAFDPEFARFGRPAARGPLIARQLRAPRSSRLPDDDELELRRRTFIACDETDSQTGRLKPFKLVKGPSVVARFDRSLDSKRNPHSVTLSVGLPAFGWLASDWDGRIRLVASVPGDIPARISLARIGLLPDKPAQTGPMNFPPHVTLQVADSAVTFQQMVWGETIDEKGVAAGTPDAKRLIVDFVLNDSAAREAARAAISVALRDSSADTPVRLAIRCGVPIAPEAGDPAPDASGSQVLALDRPASAGAPEDLIPGPPKVLVFDLPHIPARQRWLPIVPFTLAFGDPAYDRELGSPTTTGQLSIQDIPHLLAVDRAEYDLGATIYFAFWKRDKTPNAAIEAPDGTWKLDIKVVPRDGGPPRDLGITATNTNEIRYRVKGVSPYAIVIANLREVQDLTPLNDKPARLSSGDRLLITVARTDVSPEQPLSVNVGIVAEPVLPPPAASYGLAALQDGGPAIGTALFATAPLPQTIDFPDLLNDLVAGHVRRRALFLWSFVTSRVPAEGAPFAYLVKADRTGGGQQPDSRSDFRPYE
jgi:hypothetical protein